MKIEEVANTFFKWQPSIFLMEFSLSRTQDFGELRRFLLCAKIKIRSFSALV
jgi:hypothetical protein